jgi:hypothetical protein
MDCSKEPHSGLKVKDFISKDRESFFPIRVESQGSFEESIDGSFFIV